MENDRFITPRLMNDVLLKQKFTTCENIEIESIDISFGTYTKNITSKLKVFIVNNDNNIIFKTSINTYKDNLYTNIPADISLNSGTYVLMLTSDVEDTFNSVSVWYMKMDGFHLMFNNRLYNNTSIDFKLNEKTNKTKNTISNSDVNNVAVTVVKRGRGRPKKIKTSI